jgi:hypothetical protein
VERHVNAAIEARKQSEDDQGFDPTAHAEI